jgi:hypothetical protein
MKEMRVKKIHSVTRPAYFWLWTQLRINSTSQTANYERQLLDILKVKDRTDEDKNLMWLKMTKSTGQQWKY